VKIFISWSGNRSRAVAEVLSDWIKCVLQASEPWISTRHIDRGSLWFSEINERLKEISVGIVCLTQENKDKPWILFESGALAKGLTGSRVCTFLVDLQPHDLTDPLAQFNHTKPNREGVWELVRTLNVCLDDKALEERVLEKAFEVYWPIFEKGFAEALAENEPEEPAKPRPKEDVLMEILSATREMSKRINALEEGRGRAFRMSNAVAPSVHTGKDGIVVFRYPAENETYTSTSTSTAALLRALRSGEITSGTVEVQGDDAEPK
jgi:hypothetical protein